MKGPLSANQLAQISGDAPRSNYRAFVAYNEADRPLSYDRFTPKPAVGPTGQDDPLRSFPRVPGAEKS